MSEISMQSKSDPGTQIKIVADELKLREFVVEKDLYVTKVISIVSQVTHDLYDIVFQGGTSLAKAHRIIERMSEDCDFRIRFKDPGMKLSKETKRKTLRQFRHDIIEALKSNGFSVNDDDVKVRNERQFMRIRARYSSMFPAIAELKSFLAVDFFWVKSE